MKEDYQNILSKIDSDIEKSSQNIAEWGLIQQY